MKIALCLVISLSCAAGGRRIHDHPRPYERGRVIGHPTREPILAKAARVEGEAEGPWPPHTAQPRVSDLPASRSRFFPLADLDRLDRRQAARESDHEEECAISRMEKAGARPAGRRDRARHRGGHRHPALLVWQTVAHLLATGGALNGLKSSWNLERLFEWSPADRIVEALARVHECNDIGVSAVYFSLRKVSVISRSSLFCCCQRDFSVHARIC
jgi:hypothetical protein